MADARLADGSRVNVVVPPLAVDGPAISIRRFGVQRPGPEELVASGSLPPLAAEMLEAAVRGRRTVLVTGGTGSGKTTLLNALSAWIGPTERVITIEDAAELRLRQPHVVRLESRPASVEGRGEVTIRDLLRNALRMRPDRIVIGEVRGAEALDLLTALNTGHDGALSTLHANSPEDALRRLETLALMAGVGLPHDAIREQVGRGVDVVAHVRREPERAVGASARCRRSSRPRGRSGCGSSGAVEPRGVSGGARRRARRRCGARCRSRHARRRGMARAGDRSGQARRPRGLRAEREPSGGASASSSGLRSWGPAPGCSVPPRQRRLPPPARRPRAGPSLLARRATGVRSSGRCPRVAIATADALAAGRSVRSALDASSGSLEGPAAAELSRLRADLDLGVLAGERTGRVARADPLALGSTRSRAALLSQRIAGGDLVSLLRRYARGGGGIASGLRQTLARPPPRPASPGSWSRRCPRARHCSPSCSTLDSSRACSLARRRWS